MVNFALRHKWLVLGAAVVAVAVTVPPLLRIGTELMPPLDEGAILYMPSTMPGISMAEAPPPPKYGSESEEFSGSRCGVRQSGPRVQGNGSAPLSMFETLGVLNPRDQWPSLAGLGRMTAEQLMAAMIRP